MPASGTTSAFAGVAQLESFDAKAIPTAPDKMLGAGLEARASSYQPQDQQRAIRSLLVAALGLALGKPHIALEEGALGPRAPPAAEGLKIRARSNRCASIVARCDIRASEAR